MWTLEAIKRTRCIASRGRVVEVGSEGDAIASKKNIRREVAQAIWTGAIS